MIDRSIVFAVGASVIALLIILELVRRRHLSEEYSLLWLGTAIVMLVVGVWRDLLHGLADLVNIEYPPNLPLPAGGALLALHPTLFLHRHYSTDERKQSSRPANRPAPLRSGAVTRRAG